MLIPASHERYMAGREALHALIPLRPFFAQRREAFCQLFVKYMNHDGRFGKRQCVALGRIGDRLYEHLFADRKHSHRSDQILHQLSRLEEDGLPVALVLQKLMVSLVLQAAGWLDGKPAQLELLKHLTQLCDAYMEYMTEVFGKKRDRAETETAEDGGLERVGAMLQKAQEESRRISVFCNFMGLPMHYQAEVLKAIPGAVLLKMPIGKGVAVEGNREILFLYKEMAPLAVSAKVSQVRYSLKEAMIYLEDFRPEHNYVSRRNTVRIYLDEPLKARLKLHDKMVDVDVIDLSRQGICLEGAALSGLPLNAEVEVTLSLPHHHGPRQLAVLGTLRALTAQSTKRRYHIHLHPSPKKEAILSSFVVSEEKKILRALRDRAESKWMELS